MRALAIAGANLKRFLRERSNIFFVFILPIGIVLLIGAQFGGDPPARIGAYVADESDPVAVDVIELLDDPRTFDSEAALIAAVERGDLSAGVVLPAGLRPGLVSGDPPAISFVARPDGQGPQFRAVVERAVAVASIEPGAVGWAVSQGAEMATAEAAVATARSTVRPIDVTTVTAGSALFPADLGRFDIGASSQLVLFMFLTGLTGSAALIQTRQLGVSRRMLASPTRVSTIVLGEALGRFLVVLTQGLYIIAVTAAGFGVDWGDPLGAFALLVVFSAVGAGAAMLAGSLFRNDQQAGSVGVVAGIGLAALGGSMLPLDLFGDTMQVVARLTPHGWANLGFNELVIRNGGIGDIGLELAVLAAMAAGLLLVASWRLRRVLTR